MHALSIHVPTDENRAPNDIIHFAISLFPSLPRSLSFLRLRGPLSEWGNHAVFNKNVYEARLEDTTAHTRRHSFAKDLVVPVRHWTR